MIALGVHMVLGLIIITFIESRCCQCTRIIDKFKQLKLKHQEVKDPDADVLEEEKRVENLDSKDCMLKINNLRKVYTKTC